VPLGVPVRPGSRLNAQDLYLFNEGTHSRLFETLGAHPGPEGTHFAVWAPEAAWVGVLGDWNGWDATQLPLTLVGQSGIWEGFAPGVGRGAKYKYRIRSKHGHGVMDKADPLALLHESPPRTASVVWDLDTTWGDAEWMARRAAANALEAPLSIYEVHLGSWQRVPEEGYRALSYRELAPRLAQYVKETGFTHVEFLPVMEHPFHGSWGYQVTGYFAPTARYGTPQDLMYLIDVLHQNGIGVILDWVPAHFPNDPHALAHFDGTHLYEHADPRQGFQPDWKTLVFNYGRHEVRSFLLSSAMLWLDKYHVDGLRVDAVASMLYLDYSRRAGEWVPNRFGGKENLEAIAFLRRLNEDIYLAHRDVQTIAEESTAWPMVSRPTHLGGLGFGLKWDMGFMHDTLQYMALDPVHRKYHHNRLTFRLLYAFNENFVLPYSHDEVVHGKGSMLARMPGDTWQKFANLRLLYGYLFGQPGKKLLFMGNEFGQWAEWYHEVSLDWHLLREPLHQGLKSWVTDLNALYRGEPALHESDCDPTGFTWADCSDADSSVVSFVRHGRSTDTMIFAVFNFTPVPRHGYRLGVPRGGFWREVLNSDSRGYGGSGLGNLGGLQTAPIPAHGRAQSLELVLPPLGALFFAHHLSG